MLHLQTCPPTPRPTLELRTCLHQLLTIMKFKKKKKNKQSFKRNLVCQTGQVLEYFGITRLCAPSSHHAIQWEAENGDAQLCSIPVPVTPHDNSPDTLYPSVLCSASLPFAFFFFFFLLFFSIIYLFNCVVTCTDKCRMSKWLVGKPRRSWSCLPSPTATHLTTTFSQRMRIKHVLWLTHK